MGGVIDQVIADNYAIYNGDCVDVMQGLPAETVHLSSITNMSFVRSPGSR
jgi:hypothetical protein